MRLDWDTHERRHPVVRRRLRRHRGIIHTGIGPFTIDNSSNLAYGKVDWNRQALHLGFFANFLDADSEALLTRGTNGQFLPFAFATDTYNLEASNTSLLAERLILTYGANARHQRLRAADRPQRHQEGRVGRLRAGRDPARRASRAG